jgi:hypothetical protein
MLARGAICLNEIIAGISPPEFVGDVAESFIKRLGLTSFLSLKKN